MSEPLQGYLRIGELGRRTGVSRELLRAWERRYQLFEPTRTQGGFRLYSDRDVERVRAMQRHLAAGISAAQAARLAAGAVPSEGPADGLPEVAGTLPEIASALWTSLERYDESGAHAALDRAFATFTIELVLRDLILPYLRELGACWERGEIGIGQEHFASNLIHGRLFALARGWGAGAGPLAVLACAPGEDHDLGLLSFGLVLRAMGWRITYLGADTPIVVVAAAATALKPHLVVVTALDGSRLGSVEAELRELAELAPLAIGGGATEELAERTGSRILSGDPVTAARDLASVIA